VWTWKLILFAVRHWNAADVDEDKSEETKDKRCLSHIIPCSWTGRFPVFDEHLRPTNEIWRFTSTHAPWWAPLTNVSNKPYLHYERVQPMGSCPKDLSQKKKRKHISFNKDGISLGRASPVTNYTSTLPAFAASTIHLLGLIASEKSMRWVAASVRKVLISENCVWIVGVKRWDVRQRDLSNVNLS